MNHVDDAENGVIVNCQAFMNSAAIKYGQISRDNKGEFAGSTKTVTEDIVAMVAARKCK